MNKGDDENDKTEEHHDGIKSVDDGSHEYIRLETTPDPCMKEIATSEEVLAKIKEVKGIQHKYSNPDLYPRKWIDLSQERKESTQVVTTPYEFTVMQFNTLAEGLSSGPDVCPPFQTNPANNSNRENQRNPLFGGFTDIPNPEISLNFKLRRWRLLEVLLGVQLDDAQTYLPSTGYFDIIAVQEMDRYYGFFQPILNIFGYDSIFVPKPKSPGVKHGWYSDGCALFWKRSSFELIKKDMGSYEVGTQVYIILNLRHRNSDLNIIVATTHLKAQNSIQNEKIRTCQVQQLLQKIFGESAITQSTIKHPIIIMGDFNSEPYAEGNTCIRTILSKEMNSAYNLQNVGFFTTWKTRGEKTVRRVIDYIFYHVEGMKCVQVLEIPKEEQMEASKLPGFRFPSDHINIGAKFEIIVEGGAEPRRSN